MRTKKLLKAKADKVAAIATRLNVPVVSTRSLETDKPLADGAVETVVENLATIELPDGSTITVDVDNPDSETKIEKARDRVENQIQAGKRQRKVA